MGEYTLTSSVYVIIYVSGRPWLINMLFVGRVHFLVSLIGEARCLFTEEFGGRLEYWNRTTKIIFAQPACEYIILYRPQRQSWISTLRVVLSEMDKIGHFQAYIEMA